MKWLTLPLSILLALPTLASASSASLSMTAAAWDYDYPAAIAQNRIQLYEPDLPSGSYSTGLMINPLLGNSAKVDATILRTPVPYLSLSGEAKGAKNRPNSGTIADHVDAWVNSSISLNYQVTILGPGIDYVPLQITGVSDWDRLTDSRGSVTAYATLSLNHLRASAVSSLGDTATRTSNFHNTDGSLYYIAVFGAELPQRGNSSSQMSFQYAASVLGGSSFDIGLYTHLDLYDGYGTGATGHVSIDPRISIDPAWLSLHPGYSVQVEAGFGNALPVPEPETYAMMLAGLGMVGAAIRRRKSKWATNQ